MTDESDAGVPAPLAAVAAGLAVCSLGLGVLVGHPATAAGLVVSVSFVLGAVLWLGDRI